MYYALVLYPQLNRELAQSIDAIREAYDPTARLIRPHITLIYPTPESIGEQPLVRHIEQVLRNRHPFTIRLGGFHRNPDHWLFLLLQNGEFEIKELYRALYTGILADGRDINRYRPHVGLGLFIKEGCRYDWRNPKESDFDRERCDEAMRRAVTLSLDGQIPVERLHLVTVPKEAIEWTRGDRPVFPADARTTDRRVFWLGLREPH